jgi:hypothetical protein
MMHALAALIALTSPATTGQAPAPSPPPQVAPLPACPTPRPRFAAIALDPQVAINVNTTQQFVIALRVVEDGGFGWRPVSPLEKTAPVRAEGVQSVWDTAFANLDRKPGDPPIAGGPATAMFLFSAAAPGTATLTFGLFAPGAETPSRTVGFAVHVAPNVTIC